MAHSCLPTSRLEQKPLGSLEVPQKAAAPSRETVMSEKHYQSVETEHRYVTDQQLVAGGSCFLPSRCCLLVRAADGLSAPARRVEVVRGLAQARSLAMAEVAQAMGRQAPVALAA